MTVEGRLELAQAPEQPGDADSCDSPQGVSPAPMIRA